MSIETKAGEDVRGAMREFLTAFETFKHANDERLDALETKRQDDVVLKEKIERINDAVTEQKAAVDRLALKQQRPHLGPQLGQSARVEPDERKAAFLRYMRVGDATAVANLEAKSVNATVDAEGGYLAPNEVERIITAAVKDISPIRQIASVREIGGNVFRKPVSNGDAVAGWVAETTSRTTTTAPTLTAVDFPTMELYAMPAASQTLLDDSIVDIEQWLADEVQTEFAAQESAAFIAGNGTTAPKGILTYAIAADASKDPDELGYIASGADGAFAASNPSDKLLDLIYAPKQAYRANGRFAIDSLVRQPVQSLFTNLFAGAFGGGRAHGGPVAPGASYLVGERGPELFSPHGAGTVRPLTASGMTVNISLPGVTDADSFRRSQTQVAAALTRAVGRGRRNL
jgi:HK97 family phage major capsid protein